MKNDFDSNREPRKMRCGMPDIDANRIVQILGQRVAEGVQREAMQQAYSEQLEKQIETLQEQLRKDKLNGVAKVSDKETVGAPDRKPYVQ